jgi:ABC-type uncharacterized transport system substrate-binding protein
MPRIRRREFMTMIGGAATWPLAARAQQLTMPVIGWLSTGWSPGNAEPWLVAFHDGLKSFGYVEGKNVRIEYRRAEGQFDQLPALAADLVARQVSVIVAFFSVTAARAATTTIPIVFLTIGNPVQDGLVASPDRPGGNMTGVTLRNPELARERQALLRELLPQAKVFARLQNPKITEAWGSATIAKDPISELGVDVVAVNASTESEIEPAIASAAEKQAEALYVTPDATFFNKRDVLVASLMRHRMPAVFQDRDSVQAGGLISHGGNGVDANRLLGTYVGRVLKGEKPSELPIVAPKTDLVINLKTAKAFGLDVPQSLLAKATELIE